MKSTDKGINSKKLPFLIYTCFILRSMHVIKQIKPNKHNAGVKLTVGQWTRPAKFHILSIQDSVIIEMSGHFFSWTTGNEFVRDNLKALERVLTTFEQMSYLLTGDNCFITLCSVHIQIHRSIASLLIDIKSYKPNIVVIHWTPSDQLLSSARHLNEIICISNPSWCILRI